MLTLPLEPTDDRASPEFKDIAGCEKWLGQLQLTNLQLAHSILLTQLNELNRLPMKGVERLQILEMLRETVGYVQADYAQKLVGKPLPLNDSEQLVFVGLVQLWQAMVTGYQRCLKSLLDGEASVAKLGAWLCQRCLMYSGRQIFEYLRAGYEFDPKLWRYLHELYAFAEQNNLHLVAVKDALNTSIQKLSCRQVYIHTLLACYARPAELSRGQLQALDNWLLSWSNDLELNTSYQISKGDAEPLAIDLNNTSGLCALNMINKDHASVRYLPMVPLSKLLRVKMVLLEQGKTTQQVELGSFIAPQTCLAFLKFLHQCWCESRNQRQTERKPVALGGVLCSRLEGIFAHLAGKSFAQPIPNAGLVHDDEEEEDPELLLQQAEMLAYEFPLESWHFENESLLGARLVRADHFGGRLGFRQLVALRPADASRFILAATAWVQVLNTGKLLIGVRYFPGVPEAVSVRISDNEQNNAKYIPACYLPEVPVLKAPASLIVPRDWFQEGKMVELLNQHGQIRLVNMQERLERGADYDRISVTSNNDVIDFNS